MSEHKKVAVVGLGSMGYGVAALVLQAGHDVLGVDLNPDQVAQMNAGSVVVGCATVAPDFAREMESRCAAAGVYYLDAPISGGPLRAADGALSVMSSGRRAAYDGARAQSELGQARAGALVEQALAELAIAARDMGKRRFVVAGGKPRGR